MTYNTKIIFLFYNYDILLMWHQWIRFVKCFSVEENLEKEQMNDVI
jgi:hypothetical protein